MEAGIIVDRFVSLVYGDSEVSPYVSHTSTSFCLPLNLCTALWLTWYAGGTVKSLALFSTIYAASAVLALLSIGTTVWYCDLLSLYHQSVLTEIQASLHANYSQVRNGPS